MIQLSKKERGRLKKLHSKSTLPINNKNHTCSFTGIVCNEEAEEYQLLIARKNKIIDADADADTDTAKANDVVKDMKSDTCNSENGSIYTCKIETSSNDRFENNKSNNLQKLVIVPNGPSINIQLKSNKNKTNEEIESQIKMVVNLNPKHPRVTEGDDHRNLLHGLLFHKSTNNNNSNNSTKNHQNNTNNKKNKKRKRKDNGDSDCLMNSSSNQSFHIPPWATIHNPALVENIAVLEFSITNLVCKQKSSLSTDEEQILLRPILASKVLTNNNDDTSKSNNHQILYTKMKLFQDNNSRPKHITDVLMYSDRKFSNHQDDLEGKSCMSDNSDDSDDSNGEESPSGKKQRKDGIVDNSLKSKSKSTIDEIYTKLEQMILTHKQLRKEGYPTTTMIIRNSGEQSVQSPDSGDDQDDDDDDNTMNSTRLSDVQCINAQLLDYARNINECIIQQNQQSQGNISDIIQQKCMDDINQFISSSSIKVQAMNIIQTLHMHQSNQQNDNDVNDNHKIEESKNENATSHNSRLFVTSCLNRKDITSSLPSNSNSGNKCNIYAMDCEMVRTTIGLELARISLILFDPTNDDIERYKVVLDSYVKPKNYVLDYVTQ